MAIIIHELEHRYEDGSAGEKVAPSRCEYKN